MRKALARTFWTVLAALFLVEAWLWDVLGDALSAFVAALPIERLRRSLKRRINRLPAAFALAFFILPVLVILPFKLVGVALIAKRRLLTGGAVFLLAKTAGLGVTAFVFDVCRDRLLTLAWFARCHARVIAIRDWAHRQIAPYRAAIVALRERVAARLAGDSSSLARRMAVLRADVRVRVRTTP